MGHDVFISHSAKDKAAADAVCAALESNGARCWIAPRDIQPGANWSEAIIDAIRAARLMVLVFSHSANQSPQVTREVERAIGNGLIVIPLRLEDVPMSKSLEYFLSSSHWMDALTPPLENHLRVFAQKVRGLLEMAAVPPGVPPALSAAGAEVQAPRVLPGHSPASPARSRVFLVIAAVLTALAVAGWAFRNLSHRTTELGTAAALPQATTVPDPTGAAANNIRPQMPHTPATRQVDTPGKNFTNPVGMIFVRIEPGSFMMGSPAQEAGRDKSEVQHRVRLSKPFLMATTTVTQKQWNQVMGTYPSHFRDETLPVECISWDDAVSFCGKLSEKEGAKYRLPTEAEWEYCCRAGTTTPFNTGPTISPDQANYDSDYAYDDASHTGVNRKITTAVGTFKPNAWGLFDMHGNVWQWCSDGYGPYEQRDEVEDPRGAAAAPLRVIRGGAWDNRPSSCRAAARTGCAPGVRIEYVGFRVCRDF